MKRSNELRVPLPCTDHEKIVQEVKLAAADANGEPLLYPLFGKGEEGRQGGFRIGSTDFPRCMRAVITFI